MAVRYRVQLTNRLATVYTFCQTHVRNRDVLIKLSKSSCTRTFSTGSVRFKEDDGDSPGFRRALQSRLRRPLSPLERISSLLPQDVLSPEVIQLREKELQVQDGEANIQGSGLDCTQQEGGPEKIPKEIQSGSDALEETRASSFQDEQQGSSSLPGENLLTFGELLIAEHRKKKRVELRKMFQLQKGARLHSCWGFISHDEVAGKPAGCFLKTSGGVPIFIRRASLEDYVLHMKRGPAISYPKDAAIMLMMMDVTAGDCVLESGSGSGAMSLFLSRAVGSKGSVLSVEVREDHYRKAVLNYTRWRESWGLRRGQDWPDNVQFHNTDLSTASCLLAGWGFHAVALDLINPQLVLPTMIPHLHTGGVCAVYLANVTQVIDLLEGLRCSALPLLCERIIEVPIRDWVVAPALQKDGQYCTRKAPNMAEDLRLEDETSDEADAEDDCAPAFGNVPYIARPHPEQMSHTAFLVKLRKFQ